MATPIPGAYPSPRIDKGVLRWYEGDTFSIVLRFDLKDQDGEAENDQVTLNFDATVTAKFTKGKYTYDIRYTHGDKTTLASGNRAFVE